MVKYSNNSIFRGKTPEFPNNFVVNLQEKTFSKNLKIAHFRVRKIMFSEDKVVTFREKNI